MAANSYALRTGSAPQLRPVTQPSNKPGLLVGNSFWYALHFPGLSEEGYVQPIKDLAALCLSVSDHIYIPGQDVLAIDVRSSLRLFGGMRGLSRALRPALQDKLKQLQLPALYVEAASPSAAASILLSQTHQNVLISQRDGLRSALGSIAIEHLMLDKKIKKRLAGCGLHYLRDLWRLPAAALRLRFGRELSDYLSQLLGEQKSSLPRWHERLVFEQSITPDAQAETPADILVLAALLLDQLNAFLRKYHKTADQLLLGLTDVREQKLSIELCTRHPVRESSVWLMLLEHKLQKTIINSAITSVSVLCSHFQDYCPGGAHPAQSRAQLSGSDKATPDLLELLSARLGKDAIFSIHHEEDYDPAVAGNYQPYEHIQAIKPSFKAPRSRGFIPAGKQPCLLLPTPMRLTTRQQNPVYLSPLTLLQGPERVETRWWTGQDIQRDYYVARNLQGMRLWIFRDLKHSKAEPDARSCWFLQGLFA
ncbi:MAG: hypothetical protein Q8M35_01145 [Pseudohongiella sp.]|nr:hypothetical protein [Pseudohongiella sp.]